MTIPLSIFTLPSGTYTNYRTKFVGTSVILSGNYVFNGDTALVAENGSIDTSAATITVNYGGASRKLVIAAPNGFVTVGQITATDSDVYLHALGNDPTEMGTVRTVANGDIFTPTVAARGIYLWAKPRLSSTTDTLYDTISMTRSVSVTPTANYVQAMGSPFGLVVSDSGPSYTAYNVMNSGRLYRSCYSVPPGTDVGRSTNISATSYQIVSTDQTVGSAISMLDIVKEFGPSVSTSILSDLVNLGGGNWSWFSGGGAVGDILFIDDFTLNDVNWGIITASSVGNFGPGGTVTVRWYGDVNPYLGAVLKLAEPNPGKSQPFTAGVPEGLADQYRITATGTYANYYTNVFQSFIGYSVTVPDGRTGTILDTNRTISSNQVTFYSHLILLEGGAPGAGNYFVGQRNLLSLSSFYAGGANVPSGTVGYPNGVATPIPSSGTISFANFYGSSKQVVQTFYQPGSGLNTLTIPAGIWYVYVEAVGAGGGGGGGDGTFGTAGGLGGSFRAKFTITANQTGKLAFSTGWGGLPGVSTRDGGGGGAGRSYSWMNNSNLYDIDNTGNPNFRSTYCYEGPNTWHPFLEEEAIWSGLFDQQGLDARAPVAVFFPTTGNYTFQGAADNDFNVYLDNTTNLIGNFGGLTTIKTANRTISAGWHTIYLAAINYGGPQGIGLRILRALDNMQVFNTRGLTDGGYTSGNFWFLNGGEGGHAGRYGTSGAAGGGGSGTGLLWYPNNNPLTASPVILGIAPGGGGGAGTGRYINPGASGGIYLSNWDNRGLVVDSGSILNGSRPAANTSWWFGRAQGNRVPYVVLNERGGYGGLKGQGGHNSAAFYPPSTDYGWTSESGGWDGGAGGGGGAPWGHPGGYADKSDSYWYVSSSTDKYNNTTSQWNPPQESSGAGGNQGYCFLNSNYVSSYVVSQINTYYSNYGAGGAGGNAQGGFGQAGAIRVRVSNVDDGIYPAG